MIWCVEDDAGIRDIEVYTLLSTGFEAKGFEDGSIFLPQLLMSAEAAKIAFAVLKDNMAEKDKSEEKKEKIVLATVEGDIHDIGKNIVKVLLENYGFDVIDLGKDVPEKLVAETAIKEDVKLVGLSALMTTTVPAMEETIKLLKSYDESITVMVGGAVLTPDFAERIGADYYCKDAMKSVEAANGVFAG